MSKILVKSNGFGGVSYMIDPRQRGGPSFMDLGRRVFDTNLGGGQRLGALAGLAGKIGAGAVAANQAAYGLQAGNISAPFGVMDQYAALDPTRAMELTDAENRRRRQAQTANTTQRQPAESIPLPVYPEKDATGQMQLPITGNVMTPVPTTATPTPVQDPTQVQDPNYVSQPAKDLGGAMGNVVQHTLPITATQNTHGVVQESAHPQHHENTEEDKQRLGASLGGVQNPNQVNRSYVDMAFDEMGDLFHKQSAEDVAKAITFAFLKHRR